MYMYFYVRMYIYIYTFADTHVYAAHSTSYVGCLILGACGGHAFGM